MDNAIYVIIGITEDDDNGVHVSVNDRYGAHKTIDGARQELCAILDEYEVQASLDGVYLTYSMSEQGLRIKYDGSIIEYTIHTMVIN